MMVFVEACMDTLYCFSCSDGVFRISLSGHEECKA